MALEPNSMKSKQEQAKKEPVVVGKATVTEPTFTQKVSNYVKTNMETYHVKDRLLHEIIFPTLLEMANTALSGVLGVDPNKTRRFLSSAADIASTSNRYHVAASSPTLALPVNTTTRPVYNYSNVSFDIQDDADKVLTALKSELMQYPAVSVASFYQLCGISPNSTDFNYGWQNLNNATLAIVNGKYQIHFPPVRYLD